MLRFPSEVAQWPDKESVFFFYFVLLIVTKNFESCVNVSYLIKFCCLCIWNIHIYFKYVLKLFVNSVALDRNQASGNYFFETVA